MAERRRQGDGYQQPHGTFAVSGWGDGDARAAFTVGDVVWIPADAPAVLSRRVEAAGLYRVVAVFSIDEGPAFYYRVSPALIAGTRGTKVVTDHLTTSDRLHVIPGRCDYTLRWLRVYAASPDSGPTGTVATPARGLRSCA